MINQKLADKRSISEESRELILEYQNQLKLINKNIDDYTDVIGYKGVSELVRDIEFQLQKLWGFEQDDKYHYHWFNVKGCTCPKLDNQEVLGTGKSWFNFSCPFHGSL